MRKPIAVLLISSLTLSLAFTGCSTESKKEILKVEEGTPWYECEHLELGHEYETYDFNDGYLNCSILGRISDGYIYYLDGSYGGYGDDINTLQLVALYSNEGEFINDIDIWSYGTIGMGCGMYDFYVENDTLKVNFNDQRDNTLTVYDVDFEQGELTNPVTYSAVGTWDWDTVQYENIVGDYHLFVGIDYMADRLKLCTIDSSGNQYIYDITQNFPDNAPSYVYKPIVISDTEVLVIDGNDISNSAFVFNLATQTMEIAGGNYGWILDEYSGRNFYDTDDNGNLIMMDGASIKALDLDRQEYRKITDIENLDINRNEIKDRCNFLSVSDERIVIGSGMNWHLNDCTADVYVFDRAEVNPNVGKTIVTTDGFYDIVYEAAYRFNRSDDEYFVRIVPYEYHYYDDVPYTTAEEYEALILDARRNAGNRLRVDLMAGDCPDVVFYCEDFPQLNNANCMLDLSSFYNESDIRNEVFDNLIQASMLNGEMYSIPLNFYIRGIGVNRNRWPGDSLGMTFDDYLIFMDEYTNGVNPVSYRQTEFINLMVANNYDLLLDENGNINFDCDAFRQIAEFTKDNIFNTSSDYYSEGITSLQDVGDWYSQFAINSIEMDNADFVGLPSCDGRGPMMVCRHSVSIAKSSAVPEGAWRFICMLMDADVQAYACSPSGVLDSPMGGILSPINRNAMEMVIDDTVESYNANVQTQIEMSGHSSYYYVTREDANRFVEIIESIDHCYVSDSDIEIIVYEEIQAYLVGDKTLDEVIEIINSRVQIAVSERQ